MTVKSCVVDLDDTVQPKREVLGDTDLWFRSAVGAMREGLVLHGPDGVIQLCNESAQRLLGVSAKRIIGKRPCARIWRAIREDGTDFPLHEQPSARVWENGEAQFDVVMGLCRRAGGPRWVLVNSIPIGPVGESKSSSIVTTLADITPQIEAEQRSRSYTIQLEEQKRFLEDANALLETLAMLDSLTGLCNRRVFDQRLQEEVERARRYGAPLSLILIDIDEFKRYNDMFGHTEGDHALELSGNILASNVRETDVAARYGGEEFAITLPHTERAGAAGLAERIRKRFERAPWRHRHVTVSAGVATFDCTMQVAGDLVKAADEALYRSKRAGGNRVTDAEMDMTVEASRPKDSLPVCV